MEDNGRAFSHEQAKRRLEQFFEWAESQTEDSSEFRNMVYSERGMSFVYLKQTYNMGIVVDNKFDMVNSESMVRADYGWGALKRHVGMILIHIYRGREHKSSLKDGWKGAYSPFRIPSQTERERIFDEFCEFMEKG